VGTQIRFWKDTFKNPQRSKEAGTAIFDEVPWCEIRVLGEQDTVVGPWHLMSQNNQDRFKAAFQQWQKDESSEGIVGTHLKEVAWLSRGEVETFRVSFGIRTLEDLAAVDDGSIGKIPGGLAYRQKARDFLAAAKDSAALQRQSEELAKRDAEIAELRNQIRDITTERQKRRKQADD
jgi:hypothetical protein